MGPRLVILYIQYDNKKYPKSFKKLRALLDRNKYVSKTYIVLDNKREDQSLQKIADDLYYIGGDNKAWEFSAWQKGIDLIKELKLNPQVVLFTNDAFEAAGPSYLRFHSLLWLVLRSYFRKAMIGRIDKHREKTEIMGNNTQDHVCTAAYFVPASKIEALEPWVTIDDNKLDTFLPRNFSGVTDDGYFNKDAPLNREQQKEVIDYMQNRWHSKIAVAENWQLFRRKTQANFNELLLSARARESGVPTLRYGKKNYY